MSDTNERTVQLTGMSESEALGTLHQEGVMVEGTADDVAGAVPKFERIQYRMFTAEHAVVNDDLHVHFFLPEEAGDIEKAGAREQESWKAYWLETFRDALSPIAKSYFQADKPRLVAKYTPEVASWWFCARGYGDALNPLELARGFERTLDDALRASMGSN